VIASAPWPSAAAPRPLVDAQGAVDDGKFGVGAQVNEGHPRILERARFVKSPP
jgi:hypothetical protein